VAAPTSAPLRTCVGCRRRETQDQLIRLATVTSHAGENLVVVDARRRVGGRGAWLHPTTECLALAQRKRAFARAFRSAVVSDGLEEKLAPHSVPTGAETPQGTTVLTESGSEI